MMKKVMKHNLKTKAIHLTVMSTGRSCWFMIVRYGTTHQRKEKKNSYSHLLVYSFYQYYYNQGGISRDTENII